MANRPNLSLVMRPAENAKSCSLQVYEKRLVDFLRLSSLRVFNTVFFSSSFASMILATTANLIAGVRIVNPVKANDIE